MERPLAHLGNKLVPDGLDGLEDFIQDTWAHMLGRTKADLEVTKLDSAF